MPTPRKKISKEKLKELYFIQKKSMTEISRLFDCNHVTIVNRFKEFGWKSRGHLGLRKSVKLSRSGLEFLYFDRQMSLKKIGRILRCSKGAIERKIQKYGIKTRGTSNRIPLKYKKTDFDGDHLEKAYLIGFRIGDLNVYPVKQVVVIRCSTTHKAQTKLIKTAFSKYGGVSVSTARRGTEEINCFVNRSFDFLLPKWRNIPKWIVNDRDSFWSFMVGYVDAEGHIGLKKNLLEIQSQDVGVIWGLYVGMNKFGVICNKPRISKKAGFISKAGLRNNRDCWRAGLTKRSEFTKFLGEYIKYGRHDEKIERVNLWRARLLP